MDLYEAVRKLSILKEAEGLSEKEIQTVEMEIHSLQSKKVELSEMAQMRNLQWWTVEYGLIGDLEQSKNIWCRPIIFYWRKYFVLKK